MKRRFAKLLTAASLGLFLSLGAFGVSSSIARAADATGDTLATVGADTGLSTTDPKIIVGNIIRTGLGVIGIILVCIIVYGGFVWMTAAGQAEKVDKAKQILINAVVGLIIILLSWSIATFVISSLIGATGTGGGGGGGGEGGGGYGLGGGSSSTFNVTGYSPEGAVTIRNIVPRFTFSKAVDAATVAGKIIVADASGTAVEGTYVTAGNVVKFTPAATCPDPNSNRFCFNENAVFTVTVSAGLLSTSGTAITCDTTHPCSSTFTSGSLVDTANPLANITVPTGSVPTGSLADFQVHATDDAGVAGADFLVDDEWQDSISADGATDTTVSTTIDTSSFTDGTKYTLKATVIDFAGNEDSDTVSVRARPEWCFNGALDADLGETGMDCGGDSSLATYCGACDGSACTTGDECSSGVCTEGVCTTNPAITSISPQDGAVGTYVTISGTDLSANTGTVFFTDAAGSGTIEATILSSCGGGWSDTQVVVVVPDGAGDGPITITTANGVSDSTSDDNGALVPNFDVNTVSHPGLCSLSKTSGTSTSALTLSGANFGATQSSSTVKFSSTAAGSYTSWADGAVSVTVPQATAATYNVGVVVGGLTSNTLAFTVAEASVEASTITDISPGEGGIGQYVTISGTNFGSAVGTVTFTSSTGDVAKGSIDFPSACTSDYWDPNQIIIIVPATFDDTARTALTSGNYSVTITNQQGVTSSAVDFVVTDSEPTPGICGITPSADIGDEVIITGDHFGSRSDTVTFYSGVTSVLATSWTNNTVKLLVPTGSVTGPVTVKVSGLESNSANLTVGAVAAVAPAPVVGGYAWDFSTGEIMKVPAVVSECSADTVSAVPDNKFSEQGEICVNAVVYAEFTTLMNEATAADAVSVLKCTAAVSSPSDNPCTTTEPVSGKSAVASSLSASRVTWAPDAEFSTNTTYQVTISTTAMSLDSIPMARDAVWEFTTSTSSTHCVIDRVTVTPPDDTITVIHNTAGFGANAGTGCVVVDSSDYTWDWSIDSGSYVDFAAAAPDDCSGDPSACATFEAFAEGTTLVTATAKNVGETNGDVSDDSSLLVNFTDPYLSNYTPNCTEACVNGLVGGTFNTAMTTADIQTGEHILLYSCSNELCTNLTLIDSNPSCVYGTTASTTTDCLGFAFGEEPLQASSYYRVIVSGEITSESGVALIRTNYGSDFSWVFRVREDGTACAVERISLTPPSSVVADVGATTAFTAGAFGAADSCSTSGQQLVGTEYNWGWTSPIPDDTQNTSTENYTAAWKSINSELFDGGPSVIPEGCSALCTPIGSSPYQAVCGDGTLDRGADGSGEECDDGDTSNGNGCSSTCLLEGSLACSFTCSSTGAACSADSQCIEICDATTLTCSISGNTCATNADCAFAAATCRTTGTNCCGDAVIEVASGAKPMESCDDGNLISGDGCSPACLAEGSASVGATCGNNDIAFDATTHAGELCDDGNNASGDGCSRLCLPEGSQSLSALGNSLCGDGVITSPYETCDDRNTQNNDGCSSTCVREGRSACTATVTTNCCGNAILEQDDAVGNIANSGGEDCDPAAGVEGCTALCTYEGSSVEYSSPSVCGDGIQGTGEFPSCDPSSVSGDGKADPIQVAYMTNESVLEVNPDTKKAIGKVTVSVAEAPDLIATSDFTLTCSAQNDQDCSNTDTTGVGESNCCVPRPIMTSSAPSGSAVCRNAAVYGVFSEEMNSGSFTHTVSAGGTTTTTPYMYLKLNGATTCPSGYTKLSVSNMSFFAKVMKTIKTFFLGENAQAATAGTVDECILPIDSYTQTDISTETAAQFKVSMVYKQALEASSSYSLIIVGDTDVTDATTAGVTSKLGAGMKGTQQIDFVTGPDICTLDEVLVEDTNTESPNTFTTTGESHVFTATPMSYSNNTRQEITELPSVYDWTWSGWGSSDERVFTAAQGGATALDTAAVTTVGDDGKATVIATATILDASVTAQVCSVTTSQSCSTSAECPSTETCITKTSTVDGTSDVTALLCENPWPALASFPWTDSDGSGDSGVSELPGGYMNFSVSYCKDYGSDTGSCSVTTTTSCKSNSDCLSGETCSMHNFTDDLPSVNVVLAPTSPTSKVLKEYLFEIDPTSSTSASNDAGDVIGVRILSNSDYLSPMAWYEAQGFRGGPSETTVDGFQAVTDDRSTYVAMANSTGTTLYSNILVISYNEGASATTIAVYDQMLANLSFLANVTDTAVCSATATTSCTADRDCPIGETCLDDKAKIMRDTARFGDLKDISLAVSSYEASNKSCSATTAQVCTEDNDCPANETCESLVPTLSSGTAVRSLASSAWSSWIETLEGGLDGSALPTDPLNNYTTCSGYDAATCVNATSGAYSCPAGSHVYHYRSVGSRDYELATDLEYTGLNWANALDSDATDEVTYYTSSYCDGGVYGTSSVCGDGIIGINGSVTEACEIGDVQAAACTTTDGVAGTANAECNSTCTGYDAVSASATCSANSCGDGVVNRDASEDCDDGAKNGEYGYCGDSCTYTDATYCGDGVISGGESCDCGDSTLDATTDAAILAAAKPYAGSSGACIGRNGTYGSNSNTTCAWDCGGPANYCGDSTIDATEECEVGDISSSAEGLVRINEYASEYELGTRVAYLASEVAGTYMESAGDACTTASDCSTAGATATAVCSSNTCVYTCSSSADCAANGIAPTCIDNYCDVIGESSACSSARTCAGGENDGAICTTNEGCDSGVCLDYEVETVRRKTCQSSCTWDDTWNGIVCEAATLCGDGTVDAGEECDDGNDENTDDCTTGCKNNVCGDAFIYDGIEQCDQGTQNGAGCDSAYESTCTACTTSCYYATSSGEFCGDGVINGGELCDGGSVGYTWYDATTGTVGGPCTTQGSEMTDAAAHDFTCRSVGICNGGNSNSEYCTSSYGLGSQADDTATCGASATTAGSGVCEMPVCSSSCDTTCPTETSNINLLLTTNQSGASGESDANLYSYSSSSTASLPNAATITVPACTVAGNLVADVDFAGVEEPDVYVVFVTDVSGSMRGTLGSSTRISVARESIQTAIGTLYDELGDKAHIGLVHYSDTNSDTPTVDDCGTTITSVATTDTSSFLSLSDADAESTLLSYVDDYCPGGATETDDGLINAKTLLDTVEDTGNIVKIIILLSDGVPDTKSEVDAEAIEILGSADIEIYTLALTTSSSLETDMDSWSSNSICTGLEEDLSSCDIDETSALSTYNSDDDFNDTNLLDYSYHGSTTSEIESAYSTIIDSITKGNAVLLSSADGDVVADSGSVDDSHNITLPWPSNFVCDGVTEQEIPIQVTFRGEGMINISNVRIDYCAP